MLLGAPYPGTASGSQAERTGSREQTHVDKVKKKPRENGRHRDPRGWTGEGQERQQPMKEITLTQGKVAIVDDDGRSSRCAYRLVCDERWLRLRLDPPAGRWTAASSNAPPNFWGLQTTKWSITLIATPLDNRKANLRLCTCRENVLNSRRHDNGTSTNLPRRLPRTTNRQVLCAGIS